MENLRLSSAPQKKLGAIAYKGQPKENYNYLPGFEDLVGNIPNPLKLTRSNLSKGISKANKVMEKIAKKANLTIQPKAKTGFKRDIIAVEESKGEGQEVLLAHWGKGFINPIHGHAEGYLYEHLLKGKILVNTYFISDLQNKIVRRKETKLQKPGKIITTYIPEGTNVMHKREAYVHNFEALEPSVSLHYVPEHTRDGRDNTFQLESYELNERNVTQISTKEALYSSIGDVILVRSENVPMYGDHYIVIVGKPIMKEHGLRPQDVVIKGSEPDSIILDKYTPYNGVILLKLNSEEKTKFLNFHNFTL